MFILHTLDEPHHGLEDATVGFAVANPDPQSPEHFDLVTHDVITIPPDNVVALAGNGGAWFAPDLRSFEDDALAVANPPPTRVIPMHRRKAIATDFVSGYTVYARERALFWREHGVGTQPLLAAGCFAIASVQCTITACLRLMDLLVPFIVNDELPEESELYDIVDESGAGLRDMRVPGFLQMLDYRHAVASATRHKRDNALRKHLVVDVRGMPNGLGLAKLSFVLALVGNNLGCLDARILEWAFGSVDKAKDFTGSFGKTASGGFSVAKHTAYRERELQILARNPYFDPDDPLNIARAQWMLWESLGPDTQTRTHTHEELFRAIVDDRLGDPALDNLGEPSGGEP